MGAFPTRHWLALAAWAVIYGGLWIALVATATSVQYEPMARGAEPQELAEKTLELDLAGIDWRLEDGGTTLSVAPRDVARARSIVEPSRRRAGEPEHLEPAAAQLERRTNRFLAGVVGAGKAYIGFSADVDRDRRTSTSIRYGRRPLVERARRTSERFDSKPWRYRYRANDDDLGVDRVWRRVEYASGRMTRRGVGLFVDRSVPAATVTRLRRAVATATGAPVGRVDVVRAPLSTATVADERSLVARLLGERPSADAPTAIRWSLLGTGILAFLLIVGAGLRQGRYPPTPRGTARPQHLA